LEYIILAVAFLLLTFADPGINGTLTFSVPFFALFYLLLHSQEFWIFSDLGLQKEIAVNRKSYKDNTLIRHNMNKNIYLSKREQMIFNLISTLDMAYSEEIEEVFPELKPHQINKICSNLSLRGYLHRLKKGVYSIQERPSTVPVIKNPYKVALALFKGYIGFSSALRLYNLLDYAPFTIFVVTVNKSREKRVGEYTFKAVAMGKRAVGLTYHNGIYLSTISKTFFDCFYKPQYSGGYSAITKAINDVEFDWNEFIRYFKFASDSLCQRTGYVLELMEKETGKKIPALDYFRKRVKNNTKLVPSGKAGGKYIKEWKVLDNIGKENILAWWYHG